MRLDEILFEFRRVGRNVRVAAIDPVTNTEVTVIGAINSNREALRRMAAQKLAYVVAKKHMRRGDER